MDNSILQFSSSKKIFFVTIFAQFSSIYFIFTKKFRNFCSIKSKEKSFSLARFEFRTFQRLQQIQFSQKIFPIFFVTFDCFLSFFCKKKKLISKNFKKIKNSSSFFFLKNEKKMGKYYCFLIKILR